MGRGSMGGRAIGGGRMAGGVIGGGRMAGRAIGGESIRGKQPCRQLIVSLTNGNRAVFPTKKPRSQIGCKAVFLSPPVNDADDTIETDTSQRNLCHRKRQGAFGKETVGPCIGFREGISPVSLDITGAVTKSIGFPVNIKGAVDRMVHTENPMAAFHKGNQRKWSHDIVGNRSKWPEIQKTVSGKALLADVQTDSVFGEPISAHNKIIPAFSQTDAGKGKGKILNQIGGYNLEGGRSMFSVHVKGRYKGNGMGIGLAFEIPAGKIFMHNISSHFFFIPAGNEPCGYACISIWRLL